MVSTDSFAITVNVLSTCAAEDTPTERRASDSQTLAERVVHCALVKLTGQAWQQTGLLIAITGEQGWVGATLHEPSKGWGLRCHIRISVQWW